MSGLWRSQRSSSLLITKSGDCTLDEVPETFIHLMADYLSDEAWPTIGYQIFGLDNKTLELIEQRNARDDIYCDLLSKAINDKKYTCKDICRKLRALIKSDPKKTPFKVLHEIETSTGSYAHEPPTSTDIRVLVQNLPSTEMFLTAQMGVEDAKIRNALDRNNLKLTARDCLCRVVRMGLERLCCSLEEFLDETPDERISDETKAKMLSKAKDFWAKEEKRKRDRILRKRLCAAAVISLITACIIGYFYCRIALNTEASTTVTTHNLTFVHNQQVLNITIDALGVSRMEVAAGTRNIYVEDLNWLMKNLVYDQYFSVSVSKCLAASQVDVASGLLPISIKLQKIWHASDVEVLSHVLVISQVSNMNMSVDGVTHENNTIVPLTDLDDDLAEVTCSYEEAFPKPTIGLLADGTPVNSSYVTLNKFKLSSRCTYYGEVRAIIPSAGLKDISCRVHDEVINLKIDHYNISHKLRQHYYRRGCDVITPIRRRDSSAILTFQLRGVYVELEGELTDLDKRHIYKSKGLPNLWSHVGSESTEQAAMYIKGEAGSGKTTLCLMIIEDWCSQEYQFFPEFEEFHLIYLIKGEFLPTTQRIFSYIAKEFHNGYIDEMFILKVIQKRRVLIIIDSSEFVAKAQLRDILQQAKRYPLLTVIITSRFKLDGDIENYFRYNYHIMPLTDDQIVEMVKKYSNKDMPLLTHKEVSYIREMKQVMRVPLFLVTMVVYGQEDVAHIGSRTSVYNLIWDQVELKVKNTMELTSSQHEHEEYDKIVYTLNMYSCYVIARNTYRIAQDSAHNETARDHISLTELIHSYIIVLPDMTFRHFTWCAYMCAKHIAEADASLLPQVLDNVYKQPDGWLFVHFLLGQVRADDQQGIVSDLFRRLTLNQDVFEYINELQDPRVGLRILASEEETSIEGIMLDSGASWFQVFGLLKTLPYILIDEEKPFDELTVFSMWLTPDTLILLEYATVVDLWIPTEEELVRCYGKNGILTTIRVEKLYITSHLGMKSAEVQQALLTIWSSNTVTEDFTLWGIAKDSLDHLAKAVDPATSTIRFNPNWMWKKVKIVCMLVPGALKQETGVTEDCAVMSLEYDSSYDTTGEPGMSPAGYDHLRTRTESLEIQMQEDDASVHIIDSEQE